MSERPKVYVIVTGRFGGKDVVGSLMHANGDVTAQHCSSSVNYLRGDLTTTFGERRAEIESRYPDGFDIVTVNLLDGDEPPPEIAEHFERTETKPE